MSRVEVEPYAHITPTGSGPFLIVVITHQYSNGGVGGYQLIHSARDVDRAFRVANRFIEREKHRREARR